MNETTFKANSKLLPVDFPREFDAHIYFASEELNAAALLRDRMKSHFKDVVFFVGDMIAEPIGPHPLPMFEANFPQECFTEVVLWLMREREKFSVLVHPLTNDDYYDHTQGAMWLGESQLLNLEVF